MHKIWQFLNQLCQHLFFSLQITQSKKLLWIWHTIKETIRSNFAFFCFYCRKKNTFSARYGLTLEQRMAKILRLEKKKLMGLSGVDFINILPSNFVLIFWCQKLHSCVLGWKFFGAKISVYNALIKYWWNWHLVNNNNYYYVTQQ